MCALACMYDTCTSECIYCIQLQYEPSCVEGVLKEGVGLYTAHTHLMGPAQWNTHCTSKISDTSECMCKTRIHYLTSSS